GGLILVPRGRSRWGEPGIAPVSVAYRQPDRGCQALDEFRLLRAVRRRAGLIFPGEGIRRLLDRGNFGQFGIDRLQLLGMPRLKNPQLFGMLRLRRAAARLPPLIDEPRKYQAQFVDARSLGNLQIALQPLLGWWISTPAREFSSEIDLMPFRVMARLEQRLKSGEEDIDEIGNILAS